MIRKYKLKGFAWHKYGGAMRAQGQGYTHIHPYIAIYTHTRIRP